MINPSSSLFAGKQLLYSSLFSMDQATNYEASLISTKSSSRQPTTVDQVTIDPSLIMIQQLTVLVNHH